ncbi:hypothetical protein [Methylocystis iwaonis]|uniref:Uncharacterized protein n=1 Tax=Methylocystis iwaonis TaxID=2885079 RepID=A0ABN6VKB7_9HYPH|nr:hypothetical protein [Methylocystis iwaonis]BDV35512.1 hypothetical protein SS37A_30410 [Methylocystis iwaonis]
MTIHDFMQEYGTAADLLIKLATPAIGLYLSIILAKSGILTDKKKAANQELIKQKLVLYKEVAPEVNAIFCYIFFLGNWRTLTPSDVLEKKRACDKQMHIYRPLFDEALFVAYQKFIEACFREFNGFGKPATIRLKLATAQGYWLSEWDSNWARFFSNEEAPDAELSTHYEQFMRQFAKELGAEGAEWNRPNQIGRVRPAPPIIEPQHEASEKKANRLPDQLADETLFEHDNAVWRVKRFLRKSDFKEGMWVRLDYGPGNKSPEVARVLSIGASEWGDRYDLQIRVARSESPTEERNLLFSDGAFEEVEKVED